MFKYKWDNMQIATCVILLINVLALLIFPYKYNDLTETTYYGYKSFLHWVIIIYSVRIALHVFGVEIYNMKANIIGISVVMVGSLYFKLLFGRKDYTEVLYSGVVIPVITLIFFISILLLDKFLYVIEKRET